MLLLYRSMLTTLISVCTVAICTAQNKQPVVKGSVKGSLTDSTYHFALSSATIAVYKISDTSLVQFAMPDEQGKFTLNGLPLDTSLHLIITHVGYKMHKQKFVLAGGNKDVDLGKIYMHQDDSDTMQQVIVRTTPPVQMKGDTVEFNANAFRLHQNATAEDLFRNLPGFTVWGDGTITYNGKQIQSVTVDGKPFLGGSIQATTQNLPKDALDKVQVYQQRNESNPRDSILSANLKLKENKKKGNFGKLSAGGATDGRYSLEAAVSTYDPKLQVSLVGAANNVNLNANNVDVLIANASFKGAGTNVDYQPNFQQQGISRSVLGGGRLQYDFIPNPEYQKRSRLKSDFWAFDNTTFTENTGTRNTFLNADSILANESRGQGQRRNQQKALNTQYEYATNGWDMNINGGVQHNVGENNSTSITEQSQTGPGRLSTNSISSAGQSENTRLKLNVQVNTRGTKASRNNKRFIPTFMLQYNLGWNTASGSSRSQSAFTSFTDPSRNETFDRLYAQKDGRATEQQLRVEFTSLRELIFGRRRMYNWRMALTSNLNLNNGSFTDRVEDWNATGGKYRENGYLTNARNIQVVDETAGLSINRYFSKSLSNRFMRTISLDVRLNEQFYSMQHKATQSIQNIRYDYKKFVPAISVNYHRSAYGWYDISGSLRFDKTMRYPGIDQMAPLIDSTNSAYLPQVNSSLQPESEKRFSLNLSYTGKSGKNPFSGNGGLSYSFIDDRITDSSLYNSSGQQLVYRINAPRVRNLNGNLEVRKAFEYKQHDFQLVFNYNYSLFKTPGYINSIYNLSNTRRHQPALSMYYSWKDVIHMEAKEQADFSVARQEGFKNNSFRSTNWRTMVSAAVQYPKNVVWSSNITFNRQLFDASDPVTFTLWNSSVAYRFLSGNRGEIKLSALDLLRQNKSIINSAYGNSQSIVYSNVLQQYFMLTFSYYPRKFGKK